MAVRFLPAPEDRPGASREDRADLASVVELRSRLGDRGRESDAPRSPRDDAARASRAGPAVDEGSPNASRGSQSANEARPVRALFGVDAHAVAQAASVAPEGTAQALCEADATDGISAPEETSSAAAYEHGVKILARKARSSGELRAELLRLEYDPNDVENVIGEFETSHYLDDAGLARAVTEKLRDAKRASRAQIRVKLRERKLPDSAIEAALGELDADEEFDLLREAANDRARKLVGLDQQTAERRLLGFLARRGWSGEPAMRAARDALAGGGAGGGGVRFR